MTSPPRHDVTDAVYLDPPTDDYLGDRLFAADDPQLNRDGTLMPFVRAKNALARRGVPAYTSDHLFNGSVQAAVKHYWSFGIVRDWRRLAEQPDVRLRGFVVFEPPLVRPDLYAALPELTKSFEKVYVHNVDGHGYSIAGIDRSRLRKLYWPQPYDRVDTRLHASSDRSETIVVISGNHRPKVRIPEHYSTRIAYIAALADLKAVELYGRGWKRWWSRQSFWWPYWRNRRALMSVYKGSCPDKVSVLARHHFSLCFENMSMDGYVTEKIFDCFYAGTIPIYLGPDNAGAWLPADSFIDARAFDSPQDVYKFCQSLSQNARNRMREAGKEFIEGTDFRTYYNSIENILTL